MRLEKELQDLRAELNLQWAQKMEASVADSLSNATRFHKDQLDCQQQKLADSLKQEHDKDMLDLQNRYMPPFAHAIEVSCSVPDV